MKTIYEIKSEIKRLESELKEMKNDKNISVAKALKYFRDSIEIEVRIDALKWVIGEKRK